MALRGLRHVARTDGAVRELDGVVAVVGLRAHLRHDARPGLDDRDRHRTRLDEDLGHPQLLAHDPLDLWHIALPRPPASLREAYNLIWMSTPADRFRRWSSWTVLEVASTMSINRLCVSIWKCSRESLYLCGERITV